MKNIKCIALIILGLFVYLGWMNWSGNLVAMNMSDADKQSSYFIYQQGTRDGMWVNRQLVKEKAKSIKDLIDDFGIDNEPTEIAIPYPAQTIKSAFDALSGKIDRNNLAYEQFLNVVDIFNYMMVDQQIIDDMLVKIKKYILIHGETAINNPEFKQLNPDLQKNILLPLVTDYIKDRIMVTYTKERKYILPIKGVPVRTVAFSPDDKYIVCGSHGALNNLGIIDITKSNFSYIILPGHPDNVHAAAFSSDGKHIISGCAGNQNNLILWDISNLENITHKVLVGHPDSVNSVAFSLDGKHIISGCDGNQNNLILWDISDTENITQQSLAGNVASVNAVAFSPNGKIIASGCSAFENNLILWDVSDVKNITHQFLAGHPITVWSIAFSHDGKKMASGCVEKEDNLILWDIKDLQNITHQIIEGSQVSVFSIAFNFTDNKILTGSACNQNNVKKFENNLRLWDISNPSYIKPELLLEIDGNVSSVAFNHHNTKFVSGGVGKQDNVIIWTLLNNEEEILLNQMKDYTTEQIRLIYALCRRSSRNQSIQLQPGSELENVFMMLPQDMQKLLKNVLCTESSCTIF